MPEASLKVDRTQVRAGDDVVVSPPIDGSLGMGGSVSDFEEHLGNRWVLIYRLVSPLADEGEPAWCELDRSLLTTAAGLPGPVRIRIPPVKPGRYRIVREYHATDGSHRTTCAAVEVTVS